MKHKWKKELVKVYVFKEPWRFVLRVRPNVISKVKAFSAELESRQKKINSYLERTNQGNTLSRLLGHRVSRWRRWDGNPKPNERYKKSTVAQIVDTIKNEWLM